MAEDSRYSTHIVVPTVNLSAKDFQLEGEAKPPTQFDWRNN
jgi:hypothetical protein